MRNFVFLFIIILIGSFKCDSKKQIQNIAITYHNLNCNGCECVNWYDAVFFDQKSQCIDFYNLKKINENTETGEYNFKRYKVRQDSIILVKDTFIRLNIDSLNIASNDLSSECSPDNYIKPSSYSNKTADVVKTTNLIYSRLLDINSDGQDELIEIRTNGEVQDGGYGGMVLSDEVESGIIYMYSFTKSGWDIIETAIIPWESLFSMDICQVRILDFGFNHHRVINIITSDISMVDIREKSYCNLFFSINLNK